eukprot:1469967-Prymnesium_polylepis.2
MRVGPNKEEIGPTRAMNAQNAKGVAQRRAELAQGGRRVITEYPQAQNTRPQRRRRAIPRADELA